MLLIQTPELCKIYFRENQVKNSGEALWKFLDVFIFLELVKIEDLPENAKSILRDTTIKPGLTASEPTAKG